MTEFYSLFKSQESEESGKSDDIQINEVNLHELTMQNIKFIGSLWL